MNLRPALSLALLSLVLVLGNVFKEMLDLLINHNVPLETIFAFVATLAALAGDPRAASPAPATASPRNPRRVGMNPRSIISQSPPSQSRVPYTSLCRNH